MEIEIVASDNKKIKASVIIPTYNRSKSLRRALESLDKLNYPKTKWEVVIVDNNSTDNTRVMLKRLKSKLSINIRYVKEKRLSFTVARHTGAKYASGEILLYIDDDVTVEKDWLRSIIKTFESNSKIGMVGGPVKPIYEVSPPEWVLKMPGVWLSLFDCGETTKEVEAIPGPNLCIRKSILLKVKGFPPDTIGIEAEGKSGIVEKIYIGPGDWGLCQKVRKSGYEIYYDPKAIAYHHIPPVRLTKKWWHERFSGEACYLTLNSQHQNHYKSIKLILDSIISLVLVAKTVLFWIGAILRGHFRQLYEFQISFYLTRARVEFRLALNNELADRLWNIGLTGVLPYDYKKIISLLP